MYHVSDGRVMQLGLGLGGPIGGVLSDLYVVPGWWCWFVSIVVNALEVWMAHRVLVSGTVLCPGDSPHHEHTALCDTSKSPSCWCAQCHQDVP